MAQILLVDTKRRRLCFFIKSIDDEKEIKNHYLKLYEDAIFSSKEIDVDIADNSVAICYAEKRYKRRNCYRIFSVINDKAMAEKKKKELIANNINWSVIIVPITKICKEIETRREEPVKRYKIQAWQNDYLIIDAESCKIIGSEDSIEDAEDRIRSLGGELK